MDFTPVFNYDIPNKPDTGQIFNYLKNMNKNKDQEQLQIILANFDFSKNSYISKPIKGIEEKSAGFFYISHYMKNLNFDTRKDGNFVLKLIDKLNEEHSETVFVDFLSTSPIQYLSYRDTGFWRKDIF